MDALKLSDIQGFILHAYQPYALRTFVLKVQDARAARQFLGVLVNGDASCPQLATADQWQEKHSYRVNVGITYNGLAALGLPESSLSTFPDEFVGGAVAAAPRVGDTDDSAPEKWHEPFARPDIHLLVVLFINDDVTTEETLETVSARLRALYGSAGACQELAVRDAAPLPGHVAHFGYRDGFAQPSIEGGPPPEIPDILPQASASDFLLGYENLTTDRVPAPPELCRNGSYAAFRILEQDCQAFESFLAEQSAQTQLDPELIAAKLCGRWRSGAPLTLFPNADDPQRDADSFARYNSFDYVKTDNFKPSDDYDDSRGQLCPIGSHIRRMNPRHSKVAGNSGLSHRIVRRGLPYGPLYDPAHPNDGIERGLLGLFIGASLKNQFEFLMKHWANDGGFAGIGQTKDPILGGNSPSDSKFVIPGERGEKPVVVRGIPRFITTRGGAYCFLPSVTALRYLSALP